MPPFCAAAKTVLATSAATATPAPAPPTCLAIKLVIVAKSFISCKSIVYTIFTTVPIAAVAGHLPVILDALEAPVDPPLPLLLTSNNSLTSDLEKPKSSINISSTTVSSVTEAYLS